LEFYKKASLAKSAGIAGLTTNLSLEKKALPKKPDLRKNATQDCSFGQRYFDVKGILRAFYKKKVLEEKKIRDLVEVIEEKDNTRVKDFEEVFV
jgi:hypothetical protein